jgi:hypothetical protein
MYSRSVTTTLGSMVDVRRGRGWWAYAAGAALIVVLLGMLSLLQPVQAEETAATGQIAGQSEAPVAVAAPANADQDKGKGMTLFWVVLALSLLFVLGSALALNGLGDKRAPPRRGVDEEDAGK